MVCTVCGQTTTAQDGRCANCGAQVDTSDDTQTISETAEFFKGFIEEPQDPLVGQEFGGCRLLKKVGAGGMGTVYQAEQLSLSRIVALKVIHADHTSNPTFVARLRSEARVIAGLNNPNILQVFDVGSAGVHHFIIMEFVDGPNLGDMVFQGLWQDQDRCRDFLRQTLMGLGHAHSRGVIHRDIKPDNILLHEGKHVKLADFGLAKLLHADHKLTATGIVLGTPLYMSPEGAYGKALDPRSDLYSLGATFYHALSGTPPFSGETAMGILYRHIHDSLTPLVQINPAIDPGLAAILGKMLAKAPEDRYASCEDALLALDALPSPLTSNRLEVGPGVFIPSPFQASETRTRVVPRATPAPILPSNQTIFIPPTKSQTNRRKKNLVLGGLAALFLLLMALPQGRAWLGSLGPGFLGLLRASGNLQLGSNPAPTPEAIAVLSTPAAEAPGLLGTPLPEATALETPLEVAVALESPTALVMVTPLPSALPTQAPSPTAGTGAPEQLARDLLAQYAEASNPEEIANLEGTIEDLAKRSGPEGRPILERLVYLRFVKVREGVRQHLARGEAPEARAALERFRESSPEDTWNEEVRRLYEGLTTNIAEAEPQADRQAELRVACESLFQTVSRQAWTDAAYAFPGNKKCKFPSKPNAKKVAKALSKALQIDTNKKITAYRVEDIRSAPDGTRGWAKVHLQIEGSAQEEPRSVLWVWNCGKWRLDAEPLDRGLLGGF